MTGRTLGIAAALSFGVTCGALAAACTSTATISLPAGNCEAPFNGTSPTLTFNLVSPRDGSCFELPDAKRGVVPVVIDLAGTATLRPPGVGCANTCNCGYLVLYVDDACNALSGTDIISADFSNFGLPYGKHTLTVKVVWDLNDGGGGPDLYDAGTNASNPNASPVPPYCPSLAFSTPYTQTVTVDIEPSCPDGSSTDAGDAGPTDAGDAGPTDAGDDAPTDAGDAGPTDAGPTDAGDDAGDAG